MIIREANKYDLPYFIELIENLAKSEHIMRYNYEKLDHTHLNMIFSTILAGRGAMLVVENEETKKLHGMAAGLINPHLYAPHILILTQIILWVDEGFRKTAGFKLMQAYEDKTDEYIEEGRIRYGVITASEPLFDTDFSKFGYTMDEKCWSRGE
jgi:hypothetical protein